MFTEFPNETLAAMRASDLATFHRVPYCIYKDDTRLVPRWQVLRRGVPAARNVWKLQRTVEPDETVLKVTVKGQ